MKTLFVTVLTTACLLSGTAQAEPKKIQQKKVQLSQLSKKINRLNKSLKKNRHQKSHLAKKLHRNKRSLSALQKKLKKTQLSLDAKRKLLAQARDHKRVLSAELTEQKNQLGNQVKLRYFLHRQKLVKSVLAKNKPHAIAKQLHYLKLLNQRNQSQIEEQQLAIAAADERQSQLLQDTKALQSLAFIHNRSKKKLKAALQFSQHQLLGLRRQISSEQRNLRQLAQDRRSLEKLIKRLKHQAQGGTVLSKLKGALQRPVNGRVFVHYGQRSPLGKVKARGTYIQTHAHSTVHAVAAGQVIFADTLRGYGQLIILDHGNGYLSLYGQNSQLVRTPGDRVHAGDKIASTGTIGVTGKNGLYFELRHNGRPLNPERWWKTRRSA